MEGEGLPLNKAELQAPSDEAKDTNISSEEKVFSSGELVEKILGYLSPKDQLDCRLVNSLWKAEAKRLLKKACDLDFFREKFPVELLLNKHSHDVKFEDLVNFLSRIKTATRFRNTGDIQAFLDYMGDFTGNPFPSRTVIFLVSSFPDGELPEDVQASLTEFVSKFGKEIRNCIVVFDEKNKKTEKENHVRDFIAKLFQLKNLEFLSLSRTNWEIEKTPDWNLPSLEKLNKFHICGFGAYYIVESLIRSGSCAHIDSLHWDRTEDNSRSLNRRALWTRIIGTYECI